MNPDNVLATDLAWLAGIVEGEGSLSIKKARRGGKNGEVQYMQHSISIFNTDKIMMEKVEQILIDLGIYFSKYVRQPRGISKLVIEGIVLNRCLEEKKLLEAILPYMFSIKKKKAIEYIAHFEKRVAEGVSNYR